MSLNGKESVPWLKQCPALSEGNGGPIDSMARLGQKAHGDTASVVWIALTLYITSSLKLTEHHRDPSGGQPGHQGKLFWRGQAEQFQGIEGLQIVRVDAKLLSDFVVKQDGIGGESPSCLG
jgi:hypothetical protein